MLTSTLKKILETESSKILYSIKYRASEYGPPSPHNSAACFTVKSVYFI